MKNKTLLLIAIAMLGTVSVNAQFNATNNMFYHSFRMPQNNMLNPAFYPNRNSFYLQLPGAGIRFGSPLALKDVFQVQGDTATVVNINNILDALSDENRFLMDADVNLLGFGFKIKRTFITFNTQVRSNLTLGMPVSIVNTLRNGNVDDNGNAIREVSLVGGDLLSAQAYLESSLGVGYNFAPIGLTVGAHAKLLYGIANVNLDNTNTVITTDNNFEKIKIDAYYQVQAASAVPLDSMSSISVSDLLDISHANTGFAFDIGAKYDLGNFSFSFAILDLSSGIHWQKNVKTYVPEAGHSTLEFGGMDITTLFNGGEMSTDSITSRFNEFFDGLKPKSSAEGTDFWYSVPTRINLGASYNFAKIMRAGVLFHGQFDRGLLSKTNTSLLGTEIETSNTFRFNTTFSFGLNFFNWAEFMLANSIVNDGTSTSLINPGAAIVLTPATVLQVYIMADYVSSMYITEAKAFNIKAGLNLLIGGGGSSWSTLNR